MHELEGEKMEESECGKFMEAVVMQHVALVRKALERDWFDGCRCSQCAHEQKDATCMFKRKGKHDQKEHDDQAFEKASHGAIEL